MGGPKNITPAWLDAENAGEHGSERFEELSAAAALVAPVRDSKDHVFCAIDLRQITAEKWLRLLNDDELLAQLTLPVLCLVDEPSLHDWNADPKVKSQQFFVQLGEQYGVAKLASYHTLGRQLPEIFGRKPEPGGLAERLVALRNTLHRIFRTAVRAASLTFDREGQELLDLLVDLFKLDPTKNRLAWLAVGNNEPIQQTQLTDCLLNLSGCYHIGRYRRAESFATQELQWPSTQTTSQKMFVGVRRAWREWAGHWEEGRGPEIREPAAAFARLRLYFIFRDIARTLVSGGADLHRRGDGQKQVRLILLDDTPQEVLNHLTCLQKMLWEDQVLLPEAPRDTWSEFSAWFQRSWLDPTLTREFPEDHGASEDEERPAIGTDDVFLLDVDFEGRDRGPELVTWIRSWQETLPKNSELRTSYVPAVERAADHTKATRGKESHGMAPDRWSPRIMILTNARASESIQLSMNLGVETYLFKDRIYSLPAWLSQIPEFEKLKAIRDSSADFRSIHKMPVRMLARLNSRRPSEYITGDRHHIWEREWIARLPKADLHFHIGTSISHETLLVMATNTLWYTMRVFPDIEHHRVLASLFTDIWKLLADASEVRREQRSSSWCDAISEVVKDPHPKPGSHSLPGYERMVALWEQKYPLLATHDILAALVVAIGRLEQRTTQNDATDVPLQRLDQLCGGDRDPRVVDAAKKLWDRIRDATRDGRWQGTFTKDAFDCTLSALEPDDDQSVGLAKCLRERRETVQGFVNRSLQTCDHTAIDTVSLAQVVQISKHSGHGSLGKYLEGAALLGAEHLQYPENIVLAALDIVDQNVRDNVLYSEIRCAPTGYCEAGLEPLAATDILCESFDAAEVLYGTLYGRWVMTNVLLGAKRHKGIRDVQSVVELLTRYLQYPYGLSAAGEVAGRPRWWRRTRVIGFDLSGREDIKADDFHQALEPLFEYCAAITVHAGEAASAEKIWEAVYKLGARRIGHGLKLRDHRRLLEYCLTEGICLELCPISNRYTNGFDEPKPDATAGDPEKADPSPFRYPLRDYLKAGLRVAISTDNRYLHAEHRLTDDFLAGARMAGGLTRLDVLRIVKNGFYNAFLSKGEVGALMEAIDGMIFRSLAEEDERIHGPETA